MLDCGLSKADYDKIKKFTDKREKGFLPYFDSLKEAKNICQPKSLNLKCTDSEVVVPLKNASINTLERLLQTKLVKDRLNEFAKKSSEKIIVRFTTKVGVDGSSGRNMLLIC